MSWCAKNSLILASFWKNLATIFSEKFPTTQWMDPFKCQRSQKHQADKSNAKKGWHLWHILWPIWTNLLRYSCFWFYVHTTYMYATYVGILSYNVVAQCLIITIFPSYRVSHISNLSMAGKGHTTKMTSNEFYDGITKPA